MSSNNENQESELEGQMSFLEHLDELRSRLVRSVIFIVIAFLACYAVSDRIYRFLEVPVRRELAAAKQKRVESGEKFKPLAAGDTARFVFDQKTNLSGVVVPPGASVGSKVVECGDNKLCIMTEEDLFLGSTIIPKGAKVSEIINGQTSDGYEEQLIVTTPVESFTLYVTVSLYAAIALSVPFLLWQVWGFIAPALYQHERRYVTPFIGLSSISFVIGVAFAYYVLFPPAMSYLIGLGQNFNVMIRASDYFDFITLIMLAMGLVFQMPAITYVLARIGLVTAGFLYRMWRQAAVVILIVAAVASPTNDVPNMLLFALPMLVLYVVSIFVAWFFGKRRQTDEEFIG